MSIYRVLRRVLWRVEYRRIWTGLFIKWRVYVDLTNEKTSLKEFGSKLFIYRVKYFGKDM